VLLFPRARPLLSSLATGLVQRQNFSMRALVTILLGAALVFGIYHFYFKKMPTTDEGTAPTQAISLIGVREDLLLIAHAENSYIGQNGHCVSLDELTSSGALAMSHPERDGYSYSIACSGSDFTVTARHAPAPANSPIRYPNFAIDQSMDVHEVN
jgi:hypothetical protein